LRPRTALAFAPAVISNFFSIHDQALSRDPFDFSHAGATGGGFTLSKGVYTRARLAEGRANLVSIAVNGDTDYPADTTRTAVELLLDSARARPLLIELVQTVEVPIGLGFGSSSASALSAVMAVASALGTGFSRSKIASFAHNADIINGTGLGTVSSTYNHSGAGLIVKPGGPGVARVLQIPVPRRLRLVTAALVPIPRGNLLSSPRRRNRVNRLGDAALERASDGKFSSLLTAGRVFALGLGLTSPALRRLIDLALKKGAIGASQNMVGNAMHAVVHADDLESVSRALASESPSAAIDSFRIGGNTARVLRG